MSATGRATADTGASPSGVRRRVLVLGATGLLGQACVETFSRDNRIEVAGVSRSGVEGLRIDVEEAPEELWELVRRGSFDLIINAIGVLRSAMSVPGSGGVRAGIRINALFPHELASRAADAGTRVVHVSSDAVFAGRNHPPYDEASPPAPGDMYGAAKWLGEPTAATTLTVRCSFVGRHPHRQIGLIEWLRAQPAGARIPGFVDYRWSPMTTIQLARFFGRLAEPALFDRLRTLTPVVHLAPNSPLTKWEMVDLLCSLRGRDVHVDRASSPTGPVDLTMTTRYPLVREITAERRPWLEVLAEVWN